MRLPNEFVPLDSRILRRQHTDEARFYSCCDGHGSAAYGGPFDRTTADASKNSLDAA